MKAELGKKYTDYMTGISGYATIRAVHLNGCVRLCLERLNKDKTEMVEIWIDEQRLVDTVTEEAVDSDAKVGGGSDPVRRADIG